MSIDLLKIPLQTATKKPYIKQGDTIPRILFTFAESYNIDLTAIGVVIKMQVYNGVIAVIDVSNGNGITIINSKQFQIDEVAADDNDLPVGCFIGDLEITDGDGKRFTYTNVEYTIIKEYTV